MPGSRRSAPVWRRAAPRPAPRRPGSAAPPAATTRRAPGRESRCAAVAAAAAEQAAPLRSPPRRRRRRRPAARSEGHRGRFRTRRRLLLGARATHRRQTGGPGRRHRPAAETVTAAASDGPARLLTDQPGAGAGWQPEKSRKRLLGDGILLYFWCTSGQTPQL